MKKYFGIVQGAQSKEELWIKPNYAKRLPKWIYYRVVAKKQLWPYKEIYFDEERVGYEVHLPVLKEELIHPNKGTQSVLQSLIQWLKEKDVMILDTEIEELSNVFANGNGNRIHPFFTMQWIQKLIKDLCFHSQNVSIAVIDGFNKETDLVVDVVYPYVNDLRILTARTEYFYQKSDEIFDDVGLYVQIDEHPKKILTDADVVISLSEMPLSMGLVRKGAVFIDLSQGKRNVRELISRRSDIFLIDDASYVLKNHKMSSKILDMYFYAHSADYRAYVENSLYSFELCRDLYDTFISDKLQSDQFICTNKVVSSKLFHKTRKNTFYMSG